MGLENALAAMRRYWWMVLVGLIVGVAAACLVTIVERPQYTSSTEFFVSTTDSDTTSALAQSSAFSQARVTSYAQLITGPDIAERVIRRLGLKMSADHLASEISATAGTDTVLINVQVTDRSPSRAAAIAAAVGTEFSAYATQLETTNAASGSPVKVSITEKPQVPTSPTQPRPLINLIVGAIIGLLVGAALGILRSRLDRSMRSADDAASVSKSPILGVISRDDAVIGQAAVDMQSRLRIVEDYRQLRNNLQFINVDSPPKVILITSAIPGEGKSTLSINLARMLAEAGKSVTLVDADLRRPKSAEYLNLIDDIGLVDALVGNVTLDAATQSVGGGLRVIPSGQLPPNPAELLSSKAMSTVIDALREANEYVIIDSAPLLPVADTTGLVGKVDATLLAVRYGKTRREQLQQAVDALARVGTRPLGAVFSVVPRKTSGDAYDYGYAYSSERPLRNRSASTASADAS